MATTPIAPAHKEATVQRLTTLDAGFLEAEDSDRHISLAVGGLSILEGPMPQFDTIASGLAARLTELPRFREVLHTHLLDLAPPEWVEVEDLDITHHLHRAALPQPGDDDALHRFVADVMERRLDRDRPLWECWIVEGLADGKWAILLKIHHCIADGIATMHMFSSLADGGEGETFATEIRAANADPHQPVTSPKSVLNPLTWPGGLIRMAANATNAAALVVEGAAELVGGIVSPAAESSLNGPVTAMRRYSASCVGLADVTKVTEAYGVTVNDVALAALTDSYRAALVRRGEKPTRTSLRTLVPVSVRANDAVGIADNRVSVMLPFLPVEKEDPVEQLQAVHRRLTKVKGSGQREAGSIVMSAMNAVPFPVTAWFIRTATRLPQRGVVALATNVPGPRKRMTILGREVLHVLPIPPIALQLRTGVAILSYADELVFGVMADYDATPDVDEIARGVTIAVAKLVERC